MLDDRIIVQDRTADYGLAALLQNTNKNMDPYACMAMMNNNGWGNNSMWWIWMILLWAVTDSAMVLVVVTVLGF